jgi:hypothetical protein
MTPSTRTTPLGKAIVGVNEMKMNSKQEEPNTIEEVPNPNIPEVPADQSGPDDAGDQDDLSWDSVPF